MVRHAEDLTSVEGHVVHFTDDDEELIAALARFAGAGLAAGEGVLVVATPDHRAALEAALREDGRDLEGLVALDAAATLDRIRDEDGRIAPTQFFEVVGPALADAADMPGGHVRVFGEMVGILCAAGEPAAALELEALWNELAMGPHRFTLLCAYASPSMDDADGVERFYDVCSQHSAVVDAADAPLSAWRRFDAGAPAIGCARRFVASTLGRWGFDEVADDAGVVVSELSTNAVLHAGGAFHVSVSVVAGAGIRIAVHDASAQSPAPRVYSVTSATGRGLRMVDALSSSWGTIPLPERKTVWAELAEARP